MKLPYLSQDIVRKHPGKVPLTPFIIPASDVTLIGSGTMGVLSPPDQDGMRGMSARFSFANMPQIRRKDSWQRVVAQLAPASSDLTLDDDRVAKLKKAIRGRAIMIVPSFDEKGQVARSRSGEIICSAYVSGRPGREFEIANAVSFQDLASLLGFDRPAASHARHLDNALRAVNEFIPMGAVQSRYNPSTRKTPQLQWGMGGCAEPRGPHGP